MEVKGKIKVIQDVQLIKEVKKIVFVVSNNDGYENKEQEFAFEIYGTEKVDKFLKYNKVGKLVEVSFNIRTNEWQGRYFTSLDAWKVYGEKSAETPTEEEELPF